MEILRRILQFGDVFRLVIKKIGTPDLLWGFYHANNNSDELFSQIFYHAILDDDTTYLDWLYRKNPDIPSWPGIGVRIWEMLDQTGERCCTLWCRQRTFLQSLLVENIRHCSYLSMSTIKYAMSLGPHFELERLMLLNVVSNNKHWILRRFPESAAALRALCLGNDGEILRVAHNRKMRSYKITCRLIRASRLSRSDYASVGLPWPLDRNRPGKVYGLRKLIERYNI